MKNKIFHQKYSAERTIKIKTLNILPKRKLELKIDRNYIRIKYLGRKRGGSDSNAVLLPKTIQFSAKFTRALGIYYAEGNKSKTRRYSSFSNTEPKVVQEGISLFEMLGIKRQDLKAHVKIYNQEISDESLINYWSGISGIPKNNFIKISKAISKKDYERKRKKPPKYGEVEVYYSSVVIRDVIDRLLEITKKISLENSFIRKEFLKGLIAGEGSVKLVNDKLRELRIASCNKQEQKFIRKLLIKEEIKPSDAEYEFFIAISGFDNFRKVSENKIFHLHPVKKEAFDLGYTKCLCSQGFKRTS